MPARLFDSDAVVPYTRRHDHSTVHEACKLLCFASGEPVPGRQKFHFIKLTSNRHGLNKAYACVARSLDSIDLLCTMPVFVQNHKIKALVDTASNHSIITCDFLQQHEIGFHAARVLSGGIAGSTAVCLGHVHLSTCVGHQEHIVMYTVVSSLPSAQWHRPNQALIGLDVISASQMKLDFADAVIRISVPSTNIAVRSRLTDWCHVVPIPRPATTSSSSETCLSYLCSRKMTKSMMSQSRRGTSPLYVIHVKPVMTAGLLTCLASDRNQGYLTQQVTPAPEPQDISTIPSPIADVVHRHKNAGGTLGPVPPNTTSTGFEMHIDTLPGARPRAARQYRLSPIEKAELEKQIQHLLDMGWIQPSVSPWASSILFAPKPGGKLRLCIDYRYLNENTVKNTYPLPRIDTLLDQLQGHKYFTALDLASGYHQIRMACDSQPKTAFRTPDGLYQWTVMPFGLTNAPSVFQQAMHVVLQGLLGKICLAYLDDIIIISKTIADHAEHINTVLSRLHEHQFFCNLAKCQFAMTEIKYLGHIVSADSVKPDPHKVQVLSAWPETDLQKSPNNIRSFLGLAGYFRRFIPKFPTLAAPLLEQLKSKGTLPWTQQCTVAFSHIKHALINASGLRHPDLNLPFHVFTDASDYAYGAVLMQEHAQVLYPIAWIGRKMNSSEVHHATFEKELGAIVFAARQWRCYLENGRPVYIHSDHNPLRYLQTQQRLNSKQARWVESLSRINWKITYVPGDENVVADALSRATHHPHTLTPLLDSFPISCAARISATCPRPIAAISLTLAVARRCHRQPSLGASSVIDLTSHPQLPASSTGPNTMTMATESHLPQQPPGLLQSGSAAMLPLSSTATRSPSTVPTLLLNAPDQFPVLSPPQPPAKRTTAAHPSSTRPSTRQVVMATPTTPLYRTTCATSKTAPNRRAASRRSPRLHAHTPPPPTTQNPPDTQPAQLQPAPTVWQPHEEGIELDASASTADRQGMTPEALSLKSQSDKFLSLDIKIDSFWDRLRLGYSHDSDFRTPRRDYTFDPQLRVYFYKGRLVIPKYDYLRRQILLWHHVHPWHAHMGIARTAALLTTSFYWPRMHNDIKQFVSECHSCKVMKSPSVSDALVSPLPVPSACWRIVSLDMIVHLPHTRTGFDCIVVFVDQFSKMVRLIPSFSTLNGPGFAKLFFQHIYPHYGLPLGICSDRGVQWNNQFFQSICDQLGITLKLTFSYHPRANGQVERMNRVIEEALRHFVGPAHDDWDEFIPHIEFSINSATNKSTGCTPFSLNRITTPLSPTELAFDLPQKRQPAPAVMHRMYYSLAKQALAEAKQSMWSQTNSRTTWPTFKAGDQVLLSMKKIALHHPSFRRKFSPRWLGPCRIHEIVGRTAARIQLPTTLRSLNLHDVFHFSVLKQYSDTLTKDTALDPAPLPPTASADNATYEVDCIIDYMKSRARDDDISISMPHYLIRWKGYDSSHDSWLPVDELSSCLDKVSDYLFQSASASQRDSMIHAFPRQLREQLAHIVARAQRTRRPAKRGEAPHAAHSEQRHAYTHNRRDNSSREKRSLLSRISHAQCTCCGRSYNDVA